MSLTTTIHRASAISEQPSKPTMRAANAGGLLIAVIGASAAVGYGLGSLVGLPIALGLVGLIFGPIVGIVVVRARFRDL